MWIYPGLAIQSLAISTCAVCYKVVFQCWLEHSSHWHMQYSQTTPSVKIKNQDKKKEREDNRTEHAAGGEGGRRAGRTREERLALPDSWASPLERELLGDKGRLGSSSAPVPSPRRGGREGACGAAWLRRRLGVRRERLLQGESRCWAGGDGPRWRRRC